MNVPLERRMTVAEFLDWAKAQPSGRYELVDGQIVAMAPERAFHNLVKLAVARALQDAITAAELPCTVYTDGMTVIIDEHKTREPDAVVQCGSPVPPDQTVVDSPLILVEVVSRSSNRKDSVDLLIEYFSVAAV